VQLSAPNMCFMTFSVASDYNDGRIIKCGGESGGRTDMRQFGVEGFFGYVKYCIKNKPRCKCAATDEIQTNFTGEIAKTLNGWTNSKPECCNPNLVASSGNEVGAQTWFDWRSNSGSTGIGKPDVQLFNSTSEPELKQFNIPFAHKYGFCFVPYPSYLPVCAQLNHSET
jgi:hypothetical protein